MELKLTQIQFDNLSYRLNNSLPDLDYLMDDYYIIENKNLIINTDGQFMCAMSELSDLILCFQDTVEYTDGKDRMSTLGTINSLRKLKDKVARMWGSK